MKKQFNVFLNNEQVHAIVAEEFSFDEIYFVFATSKGPIAVFNAKNVLGVIELGDHNDS